MSSAGDLESEKARFNLQELRKYLSIELNTLLNRVDVQVRIETDEMNARANFWVLQFYMLLQGNFLWAQTVH